jgi:hypothetical protein
LFRSGGETNEESLLPPFPQTETECTSREIKSEQLNDPVFREMLESQMESAVGNIEIIDGVIVRWMPDAARKWNVSCVFSNYGRWARRIESGGRFTIGNAGFTIGNNTRAPFAYYRRAGNIPPSTQRMLTPTTLPNMILETEYEGKYEEAEQKITTFWLQNGVEEAWLLVIPDIEDVVPLAAAVGVPTVPLPVV